METILAALGALIAVFVSGLTLGIVIGRVGAGRATAAQNVAALRGSGPGIFPPSQKKSPKYRADEEYGESMYPAAEK
jgi:hypothetical protein